MTDATETGKVFQKTMFLYEGTFTRADVQTPEGYVTKGGTYAAPIAYGDYVTVNTTHEFTVGPVAGNELAIGRVVSQPWGSTPTVASNGGTWTWATTVPGARMATIEFYKFKCIRNCIVRSAVTPGTQLIVSTFSVGSLITGSTYFVGMALMSGSSGSTVSVGMY